MSEFIINPKVVPNINQVTQEMKKLSERTSINVKVKLDDKTFNHVNKTVSTHLDEMGRKVQMTTLRTADSGKIISRTVTNVSQDFKKMEQSNEKANKQLEKTSSSAKVASKSLNEISHSTKKVGQSFADVIGKVGKFYLATVPIQMVQKSLTEAIEVVREFDSSLIELQKVTDLSGDSLNAFTQDAFDMAEDLHTSATNVTDAITEFSKSSYNVDESKVLARQAIIFQTIADDAITASDSATMLIQTLKAYDMKVEESSHIVSAINEVSNNYAVSSSDLNKMNRSSV